VSEARESGDRYPIRGTFFGCCADAAKQSAKSMVQKTKRIILFMSFALYRSTYQSYLRLAPYAPIVTDDQLFNNRA